MVASSSLNYGHVTQLWTVFLIVARLIALVADDTIPLLDLLRTVYLPVLSTTSWTWCGRNHLGLFIMTSKTSLRSCRSSLSFIYSLIGSILILGVKPLPSLSYRDCLVSKCSHCLHEGLKLIRGLLLPEWWREHILALCTLFTSIEVLLVSPTGATSSAHFLK